MLLDSAGGSAAEVAIVGCTIQHAHDAPHSANIRIDCRSTKRPFTDELRHGNITIVDHTLKLTGGRDNMIVDNLLGSEPAIDEGAAVVKDNVHP